MPKPAQAERIVPTQKEGDVSGAIAKREKESLQSAVKLFQKAKERLLNINQWKEYSGILSASFILTDKHGNEINTIPEKGNLIKIKLPVPGTQEGDGYDWVRIDKIDDACNPDAEEEHFAIRARPVKNPDSENVESAHFYTKDASSTFIVSRKNKTVVAEEIARNSIPNTDTDKILDAARNAVVAVAAFSGMAWPQWKQLMEGFLEE
jgi:hypothetical protein